MLYDVISFYLYWILKKSNFKRFLRPLSSQLLLNDLKFENVLSVCCKQLFLKTHLLITKLINKSCKENL